MAKKINIVGKKAEQIQNTGPSLPRIEPSEFAAAIGAEPCGEPHSERLDPISLLALGNELLKRLRSTGGRPSLEGATELCKVPLRPEDVKALEEISKAIEQETDARPSLGQIASVILKSHLDLLRKQGETTEEEEKTMLQEFYGEVARYVRRGTDQIEYCKNLVEQKIEEDKTALLLKQRDEAVSDASIRRLWHHLEITLANTFRYTLLAGVCAVVEECVNAIVDRLLPDDEARKKALKNAEREVRERRGWANWLESRIQLMSTVANVNLSAQCQSDLRQFMDVITLRNCIGHAWGNVEKTDHPEQVREAVGRLASDEKEQNCEFASISPDGYLIIRKHMIPHALFLAVEIVDFVCGQMAQKASTGANT
jgi:hypothetical protein